MKKCKVILFSGIPGCGKTTHAENISRKTSIPLFSKDWIESELLEIKRLETGEEIDSKSIISKNGYTIMTMLIKRQLMMQQSVLLDGVVQFRDLRNSWKDIASQFNADFLPIEFVCSDMELHKKRLLTRTRDIPNWHEVTWDRVIEFKKSYESWNINRLKIDSTENFNHNESIILKYIS